MSNAHRFATFVLFAAAVAATPIQAGGVLEGFKYTKQPSPIPGDVIVHPVPFHWNDRCLPVRWRVNDTHDPVLNAPYAPVVSLAEVMGAVKRALNTWNEVPTSYIKMELVGTVSNPDRARFDFVNEVHFGRGFLGTRARSIQLVEDTVLKDGDDLNDDGIPDVSSKLSRCQDVGGRTKFPAGFYKAGTILDVDVIWDYEWHPFSVRDEDLPLTYLYDFQSTVTHEFGHAFGLGHSLHSQRSARDGRDAVMGGQYTFDGIFKKMQRTLDTDDVAWASYLYPEGTAHKGPAALQHGDVAFASRYGLISGTLRHGRQHGPIPGGAVFAKDLQSRELVSSGYTGTIRMSGNPDTGEITYLPAEEGILNSRFEFPVPAGTYSLYVKPIGLPPYPINYTTAAGNIYGLLDFHEEGVTRHDDAVEFNPAATDPFRVHAGRRTSGVDIVTNRTIDVTGVGPYDTAALAALETPTGNIPFLYEAVRIPAAQYLELTRSRPVPILAALFMSIPWDASAVQRYPGAMLTTGTVNPDGTASVDLKNPLVRMGPFASRDFEFTPIYFDDPKALGRKISNGIARGEIKDLFLVLKIPSAPFPGPNNLPPLTGRSFAATRETNSFYTTDGVTFVPLLWEEHLFSLIAGEPATP